MEPRTLGEATDFRVGTALNVHDILPYAPSECPEYPPEP